MSVNSKINILFIHQQRHIGGGQTYVDELVGQMKKLGFRASLLENESSLSITKTLISTKSKFVVWSIYAEFPAFPFLVSFLLGKKNIIIIYGIWKLESKQTFWDYESLRARIRHSRYRLKVWFKQFLFCLLSSSIVHLSKYGEELFFSTPPFGLLRSKNQVTIFGGANRNIFKPLPKQERQKLRKNFGIGPKDIVMLMVGRAEKRKNYTDGFLILRELKRYFPNKNIFLYLVISYGKFNDYVYLNYLLGKIGELKVGEYVRVVSGIAKENIAKFYQLSDVYLMLSKQLETFGLVTVEAISSGCLVFGYRACATSEIIKLEPKKFLFRPGSTEMVSAALANFLRLSERQKAKLIDSQKRSISSFTWKQSASRLTTTFSRK